MTSKNILIILASLSLFLFSSCKSGEFTEVLDIWPHSIDFPQTIGPEGGVYTIQIESNGIWRLSVYSEDENGNPTNQDVDWITLSKTLGIDNEDVKITVAANNRLRERAAIVKIMASRDSVNYNFKLPVRQAMPEEVVPYLDVTSTTLGFLSNDPVHNLGGQGVINLKTNAKWIVEDVPEWMILTPSEGEEDATISVTILPNSDSATERHVILKFSIVPERVTNVLYKDFYVEQNGAQSSIKLENKGGGNFDKIPGEGYVPEGTEPKYQLELTVDSGMEWSIDKMPDWYTVDKDEGTGSDKAEMITFTFRANPHKSSREAVFYVRTATSSRRVYLNQYGKENQHFFEPESGSDPETAPLP